MQANEIMGGYVLPLALLAAPILFFSAPAVHSAETPCADRDELQLPDFRVGDWNVYSGDRKNGGSNWTKDFRGLYKRSHHLLLGVSMHRQPLLTGIVSTAANEVGDAFSPDGESFYFSRFEGTWGSSESGPSTIPKAATWWPP